MSDQLLISTLQISDDFAPIIVAFAFKIDSKAKFYVPYPCHLIKVMDRKFRVLALT